MYSPLSKNLLNIFHVWHMCEVNICVAYKNVALQ